MFRPCGDNAPLMILKVEITSTDKNPLAINQAALAHGRMAMPRTRPYDKGFPWRQITPLRRTDNSCSTFQAKYQGIRAMLFQ